MLAIPADTSGVGARDGEGPLPRLGTLGLGEDAVAKAVSEPLQRALDPGDINQIIADTDDHEYAPVAGRSRAWRPCAQSSSTSANLPRRTVDVLALASPVRRDGRQERQRPHIIIVLLALGRTLGLVVVFGRTRHGRRRRRLNRRLGLVRRRRRS